MKRASYVLLVTSLLSVVPALAGDSGTAGISVTIPEYVSVDVANVTLWGQGLVNNAEPGPGNGADATFVGGSNTDKWPSDGTQYYCQGGVGRSIVTVGANTKVFLNIVGGNGITLSDGAGHTLPGYVALGYAGASGKIQPYTSREFNTLPVGVDTSTWFYGMVKRDGLNDAAGTYAGTAVLEVNAL